MDNGRAGQEFQVLTLVTPLASPQAAESPIQFTSAYLNVISVAVHTTNPPTLGLCRYVFYRWTTLVFAIAVGRTGIKVVKECAVVTRVGVSLVSIYPEREKRDLAVRCHTLRRLGKLELALLGFANN